MSIKSHCVSLNSLHRVKILFPYFPVCSSFLIQYKAKCPKLDYSKVHSSKHLLWQSARLTLACSWWSIKPRGQALAGYLFILSIYCIHYIMLLIIIWLYIIECCSNHFVFMNKLRLNVGHFSLGIPTFDFWIMTLVTWHHSLKKLSEQRWQILNPRGPASAYRVLLKWMNANEIIDILT